jgi:hypothetical protein
MKGKKILLISPFEEDDASVADPLVDMITESVKYLEAELYWKLLVSVGEKGAIKQKIEVIKQAYNIGLELK